MSTTQQYMRSRLQKELTGWLDEDVMVFIKHRHETDKKTYREIAAELSESGWVISMATVSSWVSYERKRTS